MLVFFLITCPFAVGEFYVHPSLPFVDEYNNNEASRVHVRDNVIEEGIKHELHVGATLCTCLEKSRSIVSR